MTRKQGPRSQAYVAAKELIESLDLPADEKSLVLGIALDRFQSVCASIESIGLSRACLSAVFAAALEYSESLNENAT
jgi:hypothetical protein